MLTKVIRLNEKSWRRVREEAYLRESSMKAVVEELINEKFASSTI